MKRKTKLLEVITVTLAILYMVSLGCNSGFIELHSYFVSIEVKV